MNAWKELATSLEDMVRAIVRPVVTLIAFLSLPWFIATGTDIPEWYQVLVVTIVLSWFQTRKPSNG